MERLTVSCTHAHGSSCIGARPIVTLVLHAQAVASMSMSVPGVFQCLQHLKVKHSTVTPKPLLFNAHYAWNECQWIYDLLQRYHHTWCERESIVWFSRQSNIYNASNFTALVEVDGCISSIMCQCFVITFLHVSNLSRHSVPACTLLMDTHCYVTLNVRHLQLALIHTWSTPEQSGLESVGGQGFQRWMRERSAW